jgi:protein subunit release factor A
MAAQWHRATWVRLTHEPTGLTAEGSQCRSSFKNYEAAKKLIRSKLVARELHRDAADFHERFSRGEIVIEEGDQE